MSVVALSESRVLLEREKNFLAVTAAIENVHILQGVAWSPLRQEGVILHIDHHAELACHYFDANGATYSGSYQGSGDDPRGDFGRRMVSLGIAPRV